MPASTRLFELRRPAFACTQELGRRPPNPQCRQESVEDRCRLPRQFSALPLLAVRGRRPGRVSGSLRLPQLRQDDGRAAPTGQGCRAAEEERGDDDRSHHWRPRARRDDRVPNVRGMDAVQARARWRLAGLPERRHLGGRRSDRGYLLQSRDAGMRPAHQRQRPGCRRARHRDRAALPVSVREPGSRVQAFMTPAARAAAAIEVLSRSPACCSLGGRRDEGLGVLRIASPAPATAPPSGLVYDALRKEKLLRPGSTAIEAPGAEILGALRENTRGLDVEAIAALFTGEGHAPALLTQAQRQTPQRGQPCRRAAACRGRLSRMACAALRGELRRQGR